MIKVKFTIDSDKEEETEVTISLERVVQGIAIMATNKTSGYGQGIAIIQPDGKLKLLSMDNETELGLRVNPNGRIYTTT